MKKIIKYLDLYINKRITRWVALMIQLEQQQHEEFVVGWGGWLTPTTYIQLAGAGSKIIEILKSYLSSTFTEICNAGNCTNLFFVNCYLYSFASDVPLMVSTWVEQAKYEP